MRFLGSENAQMVMSFIRRTAPSAAQQSLRLQTIERDIVLPVKWLFLLYAIYTLFLEGWIKGNPVPVTDVWRYIQVFFITYLLLNVGVTAVLLLGHRLPLRVFQWIIFVSNFVDGLLVSVVTLMTGGIYSAMYWVLLGLIVRNAISLPRAMPQLVLNLSISICYVVASLIHVLISSGQFRIDESWMGVMELGGGQPQFFRTLTESLALRLVLLGLFAVCCYGIQVLLQLRQLADEEAQEFAARDEHLHSAGRLAAQIAHQIKNPLGIINNAAYSLQRSCQAGKPVDTAQIQIIREEVNHADQIITQLMGYAQLAEARVERLDVVSEIDAAVVKVFPPAAGFKVRVHKKYESDLPPLIMQRGHLWEILGNVLLNAREAVAGKPESEREVRISAALGAEASVVVIIADNGAGIPVEIQTKIFEPYFTTKDKGTGLGLSIVKQFLDVYHGSVKVDSKLGKGSRFILVFPTRTFMKPHA